MWQKMDQSKWLSVGQYSVNKYIRLKILMLRSDLCDYSGAYIIVKEK